MPNRHDIAFDAFVVAAGFVGGTPTFALGDGSVRLFGEDAERIVPTHDGAVLVAAMDHQRIVTGGDDGRVVAVARDGEPRLVAERPRKWIDEVALGPKGAAAFAVGRQAVVVDGQGEERVFDHDRAVGGLAFAPKGLRLAVARYGGVTLWWAGTDAAPTELAWKGAHIGVVFSPDGKHVVTTMQENALHGWRLADGQDMRMSGYPAKPRSLDWSVKGRHLASSGANAAILWPFHHKDGPMGRSPKQLGPREVLVTRVACHPREEVVAAGYQDGVMLLLQIEDGAETTLRNADGGPISALAWDKTGRRLAFGTEDGAAGWVDFDG